MAIRVGYYKGFHCVKGRILRISVKKPVVLKGLTMTSNCNSAKSQMKVGYSRSIS